MRSQTLVVAILVMSCGGGIGQSRETKLQEAIFVFNEAVRWGRVQQAIARVDPESQAQFIEQHKDFGKDLQITDYEIVSTTISKDVTAQVGIQISWYRYSDMVAKTTVLMQHWEERDKNWLLIAEEYRAGEPF